jgi:hypothetical protein
VPEKGTMATRPDTVSKRSFEGFRQCWKCDGKESITLSSPSRHECLLISRGIDAAKKSCITQDCQVESYQAFQGSPFEVCLPADNLADQDHPQ